MIAAHLTVHSLNGRKEAFAIVSQEVVALADGQYLLVVADAIAAAAPDLVKALRDVVYQKPGDVGACSRATNLLHSLGVAQE